MINKAKRIWGHYETTFHLAKLKTDYPKMNLKQKIVAKLFMAFYWYSNLWFSVTMLIPELLVLLVCEPEN